MRQFKKKTFLLKFGVGHASAYNDDDEFNHILKNYCLRRVRFLSLEGCSRLTTEGLESVILSWKELESLSVLSCNNIKYSEVSPALATVFSVLKDLKWRADTKSILSAGLEGTGMGKRGKFFRKSQNLKLLSTGA